MRMKMFTSGNVKQFKSHVRDDVFEGLSLVVVLRVVVERCIHNSPFVVHIAVGIKCNLLFCIGLPLVDGQIRWFEKDVRLLPVG